MSIIGNNILAGASGNQGYEIARSLRFNDGDSAYLNRTPSSAGNRKTWTWSGWVKRVNLNGVQQTLFSGGGTSPAYDAIRFDHLDRLQFYQQGTTTTNLVTTAVYRDLSAWYHVVLKLNSTASEAAIFINGVEQTLTGTQPTNTDGNINNTIPHGVGATAVNAAFNLYMDGYMAEVNFVDGQALNPSYFGETDPVTGAWIPKQYSGTYGTNGFYLNFSDNSGVTATTLGKDSSGNGNNWTPSTNFSVAAGAGNDSLEDTPTNNWCTLNPLVVSGGTSSTLSNGNLDVTSSATHQWRAGTIGVSSGKWYVEYKVVAISNTHGIGIRANISTNTPSYSETTAYYWQFWDLNYHNAGSSTSYGARPSANDIVAMAIDLDNGTIEWFVNNTSQGQKTGIPLGDTYQILWHASSSQSGSFNFGQRAFDYTPPTGFMALNTANLPVPTIKDGTEYFKTVLYTGDDSVGRAITVQDSAGNGWQPDFVWVKARNQAYSHHVYDAVRGASKRLLTNGTQAEFDQGSSDGVSDFNSNGFDVSHTSSDAVNQLNTTYAAFNWKAGGSGSTISTGDIDSTVSVNADAGFSIVKFTPTASSGAFAIGHGLGVTPQVIIQKQASSTGNWHTHHRAVCDTASKYLLLNGTGGVSTSPANVFGVNLPDSSTFEMTVGASVGQNVESIAYCFAEVEGYSKFGTYTANGSADGTFVYTGFRPAFLLIKRSSASGTHWAMLDNARSEFNVVNDQLFANLANTEYVNYTFGDFTSNGFKIRDNSSGLQANYNTSGATYIYMAFAETPFKYANAR